MIITMKKDATKQDIENVMRQLKNKGLQIHERYPGETTMSLG